MKVPIWWWLFTRLFFTQLYYGDCKYLKMRFSDGSCWTKLEEMVGKNSRGLVKILIAENIHDVSIAIGENGAQKIMERDSKRISSAFVDSVAREVESEVIQALRRIHWKRYSRLLTKSSLHLLCDSLNQCCFKE